MFITWGSRAKHETVERGRFYCPQCRASVEYALQSVREYFTLYFVPLFQTRTLGEYVECRECGGQFQPAVRGLTAENVGELLRPWVCPDCQNLNGAVEERCLRCRAPHPQQVTHPEDLATLDSRGGADRLAPYDPDRLAAPARGVAPAEEPVPIRGARRCPECGVINRKRSRACSACGSDFTPLLAGEKQWWQFWK
jgi:hypothetical protein